ALFSSTDGPRHKRGALRSHARSASCGDYKFRDRRPFKKPPAYVYFGQGQTCAWRYPRVHSRPSQRQELGRGTSFHGTAMPDLASGRDIRSFMEITTGRAFRSIRHRRTLGVNRIGYDVLGVTLARYSDSVVSYSVMVISRPVTVSLHLGAFFTH